MASIRFEGVTKRFPDGTVALDALSLTVKDGEFITLVGPSGCGKTTALRMVAGFEGVTEGQIVLGDRVVNDVEPAHRDIAMVFQNYALYPHFSVADNIGFPLKMRGVAKRETAERVAEVSALLGLDELLGRRPNELSGGQRQRVAMGRAIIRHPQAFLLDEPLSNLDAKRRTEMRAELARLHRRLAVTTVYVTHDQTEAMTLGSRIVVLRDGTVQQTGSPNELYRAPANAFVATFIGSPAMNLLRGRVEQGRLRLGGVAPHESADVSAVWPTETRDVAIGVRPEAWRPGRQAAGGPAIAVGGEVEVVEDLGNETLVYVAAEHGALVARFGPNAQVSPGQSIEMHAEIASLHLFDAETEAALARRDGARIADLTAERS